MTAVRWLALGCSLCLASGCGALVALQGDDLAQQDGGVRAAQDGGSRTDDAGVISEEPLLIRIDVEPAASTVRLHQLQQLSALGSYNDGSRADLTDDVSWASDDENVAAPGGAPGVFHALAEGQVTITARHSSPALEGSTTLTVAPVVVDAKLGQGHALILLSDGSVYCFGRNSHGECGRADLQPVLTPMRVSGLPSIAAIAAGGQHSLALAGDGTVWAWGSYRDGRLGDGRPLPTADGDEPWAQATPKQVVGPGAEGVLQGIVQVAAGFSQSLALDAAGDAFAWGHGAHGALGTGSFESRSAPSVVIHAQPVVRIVPGAFHSLLIDDLGHLYAFGYNAQGQLGNGATESTSLPTQVLASDGIGVLDDVVDASGGWVHSLVARGDGSAFAFGGNNAGQLGIGSKDEAPHPLPEPVVGVAGIGTLSGVARVVAGNLHSGVLRSDGRVTTWGNNQYGQLGVAGTTTAAGGSFIVDRSTPEDVWDAVARVTDAIVVSAGADFTAMVRSDGSVWAWGRNEHGQLGDGRGAPAVPDTSDRHTPQPVSDF